MAEVYVTLVCVCVPYPGSGEVQQGLSGDSWENVAIQGRRHQLSLCRHRKNTNKHSLECKLYLKRWEVTNFLQKSRSGFQPSVKTRRKAPRGPDLLARWSSRWRDSWCRPPWSPPAPRKATGPADSRASPPRSAPLSWGRSYWGGRGGALK